MALSNAPTAKRALYDAIAAATYVDPQPGIWYGSPNVEHNYHDNVTLCPTESPMTVQQEIAHLGRPNPTRNEIIEIPIRIEVFREGTDQFAADDRAWELADVIQATIGADISLGAVVWSSVPNEIQQPTEVFADGRMAIVNLTIECHGQIR